MREASYKLEQFLFRGLTSLKAKRLRNSRTVIPIITVKKADKEPNTEKITGLDLHSSSDLYSTRNPCPLQDKN